MTEQSPIDPAALPFGGGVCGADGPPLMELAAYADGAIDGIDRAAIESHLAACVVCREAVTDLREHATTASNVLPFAPAHVIAAAAALVPHDRAAASSPRSFIGARVASAAAAIAVCVAGYAVGLKLASGGLGSEDGFDPAASFGFADTSGATDVDEGDLLALALAESSS